MVRCATGTFPDCPSVLPDREQTFEFITVLLPVDFLLHAFYKKLKVCEPQMIRITIKGHACYRSAREQSRKLCLLHNLMRREQKK